MKTKFAIWCTLAMCAAIPIHAQTTTFTYQGRLTDGPDPADGVYDLRFAVHDASTDGNLVGGPQTNALVSIKAGLFTAPVDFGASIFNGADRWLEIAVRTNGATSFITLSPRQMITSTPYALFAAKASTASLASSVAASNLTGLIQQAQLPFDVLFNGATGVNLSGAFSGNGGALSNLDALTLSGVGSSGFWRTDGNAGTSPGSNFLGTTDNQPLEFKVNGQRALRIEPVAFQGAPNLIGGHASNSVGANVRRAVIAGGGDATFPNTALGDAAFIGAGLGNQAGISSSVVGGLRNVALGRTSFVGGGTSNTNLAESSVIGGGDQNTILSVAAAIGGGENNQIRENSLVSVIAGGWNNTIGTNALSATISGGNGNKALDDYSTVGGGALNEAGGYASTVGGGYANKSSGVEATVSGGDLNSSSGDWSAILGGFFNEAAGYASTVAGGYFNHATGSYSFAAGRQAVAAHPGAFVWADSQLPPFSSTAANQFSIRAAGGFRLEGDQASAFFTSLNHQNGSVLTLRNLSDAPFYLGAINFANKDDVVGQIAYLANHSMKFSLGGGGGMTIDGSGTLTVSSPSQSSARFTVDANANLNFGAQVRQMLNLWNAEYGIGVQVATEYFRTSGGFSWFHGGTHSPAERDPGGGYELMNLSEGGDLTIAGTFGNLSDRNAKENFETVDGREILDKVAALPISKWNYKTGRESRHIGPMAQDFHSAFGLGADDRHITTIDADGIALAAIQGLNEKNRVSEARIQKLETENGDLKARLEKLETLVSKLGL